MKWKKFKKLDKLKVGDIVFVKGNGLLCKTAYVDHASIKSIPEQWSHDLKDVEEDGTLKNYLNVKVGKIISYYRLPKKEEKIK
jgi:hypothetical protein